MFWLNIINRLKATKKNKNLLTFTYSKNDEIFSDVNRITDTNYKLSENSPEAKYLRGLVFSALFLF